MSANDQPGMRDDARALVLLKLHARTATAFQVLAPGMRHWFAAHDGTLPGANDTSSRGGARGPLTEKPSGHPVTDAGMVAYSATGNAWVAAGEPIAPRISTIAVAEQFVAHANASNKRVAFFATEGALASSPRFRRVLIGEQPTWNPTLWQEIPTSNRSLREQLRRARAKGVRVRAITTAELNDSGARLPALRIELQTLIDRWLATRPMSALHFLVEMEPFENVDERKLFVAERLSGEKYKAVAFLSLAPVAARNGWLFEHLLRDPGAPNGSSELLVDFAMRTLAAEGVVWATLGLAPLAGPVSGWLRVVRNVSRPFYNFAGLTAFKRKLKPHSWEPIYLAYPRERSSVWAMYDGLRAFAGGSLLRFAMRTVLRGPPPILRALAYSLVPWTVALAMWPASPWFPSPVVKWAWVVFDALLWVSLFRLRRRWTQRAAARVASVVTLDAAVTMAQALLWNVWRTRSLVDAAMVAVACAGPVLAAVTLWGTVRRLSRLGSE